ncbi:MAG: hypothetical protein K2X93_23265 [Candidatus Obscuribacterales bacterium]|nr:hypothetical protein [Candidatus Obscuribacterales bacterium]
MRRVFSMVSKHTPLLAMVALGLVSSGCNINSAADADKDGAIQARNVIGSLGHNWSCDELEDKLDPSLKISDAKTLFSGFSKTLGPIQSIGDAKTIDYRYGFGFNTPSFTGTYTLGLKCKNEEAVAKLTMWKKDNRWYLANITVSSPKVEQTILEQNKGALLQSRRMVARICDDWNYDYFQSNISSELHERLKVAPLVMQGVLAASKNSLGKARSIDDGSVLTATMQGGRFVYLCRFTAQFEKGNAIIDLGVVKERNKWLIQSINISGSP